MPGYQDVRVRFDAKYDIREDGCWIWTASTATNGYGCFWDGVKLVRAHRWSYENSVGPIPAELQLDHLCRVRACVNPDHLEPVTNGENQVRRYLWERSQAVPMCRSGKHPLVGSALHFDVRGKSRCRTCNNEKNSARNRARRGTPTTEYSLSLTGS